MSDPNKHGDAFIADLLKWARRLDVETDKKLLHPAVEYRNSLLWRTIPVRLHDSIELPDVSGEFEAR